MNRELLRAELIRDEGERLKSYKDSLGYWTIGVGHLIDPVMGANPAPFGVDLRNGGVITEVQSAQLLDRDVAEKERELDAALPWWRELDEVRQRVLLNMAFNLGIKGLLAFKNTLAMVRAKNYAGAASGMLASKWASQVKGRADRLAAMMRTGAA